MPEHIELLKKEIVALQLNLDRALNKHSVKSEEIKSIQTKLRLKRDILSALSSNHITYAVFWKLYPSEYEPNPEWRQFTRWRENMNDLIPTLNELKNNPRCEVAKIVRRTEIYRDIV